ncbi:MAG TPA: exodeoxyribonuclease VII large subunit [Vicinamibacterales bacterium]|nr:exodeoxyribonuclease VII large subunit [Vicinamibacterales bacterium]
MSPADDWTGLPFDELDPPEEIRAPAAARAQPDLPLSVSELSAQLKQTIEGRFGRVLVEGEVSNCRAWSSGHIYFTLKDDYAQIRAVMFRSQARQLKFSVDDGLRVVARGRLGLYEVKGDYQLIVDALEPHGLGALQAAFEHLKRTLQAEGLFDAARKRPLPVLPRRIGIVTSADGAALHDILRVIGQRHSTARIVVRPARVQGDEAPADLVRALRAIVKVPEVDVVIIGRGGGSAEDLWAFNDERLARAIAACPVPVISAVGHEVDFTIADFVADVRAATPSNAAELVVDRADNFCARIDRATERLSALISRLQDVRHQRVERATVRLEHWPAKIELRERDRQDLDRRLSHALRSGLGRDTQRFQQLRRRLERRDIRRVIADLRARTVAADHRIRTLIAHRRHTAVHRAARLAAQLDALSPLAVLGRGYALCWNDARTGIIRSSASVSPGDRVRVTLAEGELGCRVEETKPPQ